MAGVPPAHGKRVLLSEIRRISARGYFHQKIMLCAAQPGRNACRGATAAPHRRQVGVAEKVPMKGARTDRRCPGSHRHIGGVMRPAVANDDVDVAARIRPDALPLADLQTTPAPASSRFGPFQRDWLIAAILRVRPPVHHPQVHRRGKAWPFDILVGRRRWRTVPGVRRPSAQPCAGTRQEEGRPADACRCRHRPSRTPRHRRTSPAPGPAGPSNKAARMRR